MNVAFHHVCIETPCYEASLAFYRNAFGFEIEEDSVDFHGRAHNSWLRRGNVIIELQTPKAGSSPTLGPCSVGLVHLCFSVDDVEAAVLELESLGVHSFLAGKRLYRVKGASLSKLVAPEGTIIELRLS